MANREILFRGKTIGGDWAKGSLLTDAGDFGDTSYIVPHGEEMSSRNWAEVRPETLGQYLCNNQSGKVFDGDILVFPNGSIGVMLIKNGFPYIGSGDIGEYHSIDSILEHEVAETKTAGNIYDNPDLIDPSTIISFGKLFVAHTVFS